MSKQHGARQQKRAAKQKAKRDDRHRQLAKQHSPNPAIRLANAADWPIVACLVPIELWEVGIGNLTIVRRTPSGEYACAAFLVDVFCLGVKNADWSILGPAQYNEYREHFESLSAMEEVVPEYFAKLVYQAADYGQSLGFPQHRDFVHAQRLLAGIDVLQCTVEFEFGYEGKPRYIRGPNESLERARSIAMRVQELGGHYVIPLAAHEQDAGLDLTAEQRLD